MVSPRTCAGGKFFRSGGELGVGDDFVGEASGGELGDMVGGDGSDFDDIGADDLFLSADRHVTTKRKCKIYNEQWEIRIDSCEKSRNPA